MLDASRADQPAATQAPRGGAIAMPRGFFRQYPAPSDFGFEENQPVPLRVLLGAMIRTWCSRLRAILAPDPATPAEDADDQTEARGA